MLVDRKYIHVAKGSTIEEGALIGHKPIRKIKKMDLYIGKDSFIMSGAIVYAGTTIGRSAAIAHNSVIREENIIGDAFSIWDNSVIDYGCKIGNDVKIHCNVYIPQFTQIEDEVFVAPGTTMANDLHPKCKFSKKCMKGPYIKKWAVIGANVTINPFVVIGERAVIGAGSVVTKDIPKGKVAYGNPARIIGDISELKCRRGFTDFPYRSK